MESLKRASRKNKRDLPFIHRKIARRRKHSNHVLAKQLVSVADYIYVGNLSSKWLFSGSLARSALDAGYGQLFHFLTRKAENAGKLASKVNETRSTGTCYGCGSWKKVPLSDRVYACSHCSYTNDRDVNAALNIMKIGESLRLSGHFDLKA